MRLKNAKMRGIYAMAIGISVGIASSAWATYTAVPIYEPFNYTASTSLGTDGQAQNPESWFPNPNNASPDIQVTSGNLTFASAGYANGPASSGNSVTLNGASNVNGVSGTSPTGYYFNDDDRLMVNNGAQLTSGTTVYYSYLINLTSAPSGTAVISGFSPGTGSGTLSQILGSVLVKDDGSGTGYELAVANDNGGNSGGSYGSPSLFTGPINYGTTAFVVVGYQIGTGNYSLYLDPALGLSSAPSSPTVGLTGSNPGFGETGNVGTFFLAQDQNLGSAQVQVDELRIGTTFSSVDPAAVPEPASLGMLGIGGLMLLRRRTRRA